MAKENEHSIVDLFIVGGGVNGCGVARDAAGRGLSVTLAEMEKEVRCQTDGVLISTVR